MRAVVRTTDGPIGRRYYVLRSCARGSDPTPEHTAQSLSRSRLYDEPGLVSLTEANLLLINEDTNTGITVVFVALDAHRSIGGQPGGFLKTIKTRTRTAFVHQSEIGENQEYWDEQLLWLTRQHGPIGRRYYVLRSCTRGSDPTPEHTAQSLSRSRLYDEPGLVSLTEANLLLINEDTNTGATVVFVALDAHRTIGGQPGGFLKTIKTRTRTAFVHQSEIGESQGYWDEQLLWLTRQHGPVGRRYYVLRSCTRGSDPTPTHAAQTLSRSRLYDESGLVSLAEANLLLINEDAATGTAIVFVALDAHKTIGGQQGGFLKTIKTRTRTAFVHQSEVGENQGYWDEQLLWLTRQLGVPVSFVERTPKLPATPKRSRGLVLPPLRLPHEPGFPGDQQLL
eukprot:m51a1_g14627 hypothetical protein (395) ;mRNA; f:3625-7825